MLEPIRFKVISNTGEALEGRLELPDQIAIERNFDCSILQVFSEHSAERLAYGAWYHLRRMKKITDTTEFDPWVATIIELKDSATGSLNGSEPEPDPKAEATEAQPASSS